jgi:hypothetical protein
MQYPPSPAAYFCFCCLFLRCYFSLLLCLFFNTPNLRSKLTLPKCRLPLPVIEIAEWTPRLLVQQQQQQHQVSASPNLQKEAGGGGDAEAMCRGF